MDVGQIFFCVSCLKELKNNNLTKLWRDISYRWAVEGTCSVYSHNRLIEMMLKKMEMKQFLITWDMGDFTVVKPAWYLEDGLENFFFCKGPNCCKKKEDNRSCPPRP